MNYKKVNIDYLKFYKKDDNNYQIYYNEYPHLEIYTPIIENVKLFKDKYKANHLSFNLKEQHDFKELVKCLDVYAMLSLDMSNSEKGKFRSSLSNDTLFCKIHKNRPIDIFLGDTDSRLLLTDIKNETIKAIIYIDSVWKEDTVSLKWKVKEIRVYRN